MEQPGNAPPENNWAILGLVWRRKIIVILVAGMGLGLGYLFFLRQTPVYKSTAQVLIIKEQVKLPIEGMEFSPGYDTTHETIIRSPLVVDKAAKNPEITSLVSLRGSANPTAQIIGGLSVKGGGGQTGVILTLGYESLSREDCPTVLTAVVQAYQDFLGDTRKKDSDETVVLVKEAKGMLDGQIKELTQAYAKFRETSPLLVNGETSQNVHESRLKRIEEVRSGAVLNNSELQAQIEAIEAALKRGGSREALNLMVGKLSQAENVSGKAATPQETIQEKLFPLMLQEQELLEKNNYGPDHPQVRMLRKHIELTRELLRGRTEAETGTKKETPPADFYQVYLQSLREKIDLNTQTIASMSKLFEDEQKSSRDLTSYQLEDENFRSEISQKKRLFELLMSKLEDIKLTENTGGARVEVIHPASAASQVRPDMKSIMMAAGMLGLMAGLGLAYLVDAADRRFRSPEEIRNDFGLPVFGHIPVIAGAAQKKRIRGQKEKSEAGKLSDALAVYHQPKGRTAEAYRGVRTALFFSTRISGHKVFQVTSPSPGDGKTTSICNLAVSIADAGKKVVLIDADFRRPRVHHVFGIQTETGMSSVIEGTIELDDATQATPIPNLSVLPCGPRPSNPAELLSSRRFEELLEVLREKYEYILIDSPPILAVTDPLNVAARVDGLLLVMRLTKTARHNGRRALESLEAIGANVLGVIINGVGKTAGYGYGYGYGYGGYNYGRYGSSYGYGSRYGYGGYGSDYRYGYGDDKTYYTDDEHTSDSKVQAAAKHSGNGNGKA